MPRLLRNVTMINNFFFPVFFPPQFCEVLKSIIRDQRTVIVSGLLGIISVVYFGMAPLTTLPTILIPFTLWMAG